MESKKTFVTQQRKVPQDENSVAAVNVAGTGAAESAVNPNESPASQQKHEMKVLEMRLQQELDQNRISHTEWKQQVDALAEKLEMEQHNRTSLTRDADQLSLDIMQLSMDNVTLESQRRLKESSQIQAELAGEKSEAIAEVNELSSQLTGLRAHLTAQRNDGELAVEKYLMAQIQMRRHAERVHRALIRLRDANEAAEQQRALDAKHQVRIESLRAEIIRLQMESTDAQTRVAALEKRLDASKKSKWSANARRARSKLREPTIKRNQSMPHFTSSHSCARAHKKQPGTKKAAAASRVGRSPMRMGVTGSHKFRSGAFQR